MPVLDPTREALIILREALQPKLRFWLDRAARDDVERLKDREILLPKQDVAALKLHDPKVILDVLRTLPKCREVMFPGANDQNVMDRIDAVRRYRNRWAHFQLYSADYALSDVRWLMEHANEPEACQVLDELAGGARRSRKSQHHAAPAADINRRVSQGAADERALNKQGEGVDQYERSLAAREAKLYQREAELQEQRKLVKKERDDLARRRANVEQREQAVAEGEAKLNQREAELQEQRQVVKQEQDDLARRRAIVGQREQAIRALAAQPRRDPVHSAAAEETAAAQMRADYQAALRRLEAQLHQVEKRQATLEQRAHELERQEADLARRQRQVIPVREATPAVPQRNRQSARRQAPAPAPAKPSASTARDCRRPNCGGELVERNGQYGKFFGCTNYPECRYSEDVRSKTAQPTQQHGDCPDCESPLVPRQSYRGPFLGCSNYPRCRYTRDLPARQAPATPARR